jgi:polysaccharide export outer membrane protein
MTMTHSKITRFAVRLLVLFGLAGHALAAQAQATSADYKLQAGDKLHVSVWKEPEMQKEIIIAPDGKISFPLAGELSAAGRPVGDVRKEIETRLKKYIPDPVVTVTVLTIGGNIAYVVGQVTKPGAIVMNPSITVLQALSIAGGGTPFAKMDSIIVIRGAQAGEQRVLPFRYGQVSEGKNLQQNVVLESGDVVVVP